MRILVGDNIVYMYLIIHVIDMIFFATVPSRYSSAMTIQLYIVNLLEELGIAHHFTNEIDDILNETHR